MSIPHSGGVERQRLAPEQIRRTMFGRTPLGRRGLSEDEVYGFLYRVAEEVGHLHGELGAARAENDRLKTALREWQHRFGTQTEPINPGRRNMDAVVMMARVQQQIDTQLAEAEMYCRKREQEARQRYDEIVRQAQVQAQADAEQAAREYRSQAGASYSADQEQVHRQQVYLGALLRSLDAVAAHLDATREVFSAEITKLAAPAVAANHPPQRW